MESNLSKRKRDESETELEKSHPPKRQRSESNVGTVATTTLLFELFSPFITSASTLCTCSQVCHAWKEHVEKNSDAFWKSITIHTFQSYAFFHKELAESFDAPTPEEALYTDEETSEKQRQALLVSLEDAVEEELSEEKELLALERAVDEAEEIENAETPKPKWQPFYKNAVHMLMQDFAKFKKAFTTAGVEWKDEYASCLRLGVYLISADTEVHSKDYQNVGERQCSSYAKFVNDAVDGEDLPTAITSLGGNLVRPASNPNFHPGTNNGQGFMAQVFLQDFKYMMTTHGRLPDRGSLSFYYSYQSGQVVWDPDFDANTKDVVELETDPESTPPYAPILALNEYLFIDTYSEPWKALGDWNRQQAIETAYNDGSRCRIAIEHTHIIGGQSIDFQGNHWAQKDDFQLLQTDVDFGSMLQFFFIGKEADIKKHDFSKIQAGDSLSR